ncbi:MAG TPA: TonB family protein [Steroidobacteraceae bacterium]|nr:TonB family protein [Steroidobacteraceae bacterium]
MSRQSPNEGSGHKGHDVTVTWDLTVAHQLIGCAARKAPPGLAERLEEEWLADLTARRGAFARLRFGLGCCWATRVIAREFGVAAAAAGSSGSGQQVLVAYGGFDFSRVSRRTIALLAIVCLHVGVFYLYLSGFTRPLAPNDADPIAGRVIDVTAKPRPRTTLAPPTFTPTVIDDVLPPVPRFKLPADPTAITVPHSAPTNVGPVQPPTPQPITRVMGGPGAGFPNTGDYYPSDARRLDEAGNTVVSVCVDPSGRLTAAPAIVDSSGFKLIDQGALGLARAGSGHYRPTTENGRPVSSCYAFRISFRLEDQ